VTIGDSSRRLARVLVATTARVLRRHTRTLRCSAARECARPKPRVVASAGPWHRREVQSR
jgi:hypothetical protein